MHRPIGEHGAGSTVKCEDGDRTLGGASDGQNEFTGVLSCMCLHCQGHKVPQWATFLKEGRAPAGVQQAMLSKRTCPARFCPYYTQATVEHKKTSRGVCCLSTAGIVPVPEQGELGQGHLQPCLLGPGVAAEDVQDHRESVKHLHAPGGLQLFLEKESV